ncbi:MAG: PAS domain S-box protein [Chryseolinea sp.]
MDEGKIRLLMLEDNSEDAYLIERNLRKAKFNLEVKVASDKTSFVQELEMFHPHLIISDHQLPQFSSQEALKISRKKFPLIPFILVTGAVSEEFAAAIIRAGADDYLLKSNIKRLPTAVTQAMEKRQTQESLQRSEAQNRAAEIELIDAHKRLFFHIENTPLGYIEWDSKLYVKSWSKCAEDIFGWNEKELLQSQKNATSLIYEGDFASTSRILEQLLSGTVDKNKSQNRNYAKDGRVIWCDWFNSVMKNDAGDVVMIMSMVQDITAQKTVEGILEEYNDRYKILSRATNDAIWDWSIDKDFELWNHGIQTIFGYSEREIRSTKKWRKAKIHPDDYDRVTNEIKDTFTSRATNWTSQYQYLCADGNYKHVLDRGYVIYHEARPVRMIGAIQDITDQTNNIREIEKLSLVASKTNNAVVITNPNNQVEWVNDSFVHLTGYTQNEVNGKNPITLLQGDDTDPETSKRITTKLKNREWCVEDIINYTKTGRKYWSRIDVSPVFDSHNNLINYISIQNDISAQKKYENQIKNTARELSSLIENANVPIFGVDLDGNINEWNTATCEVSGYLKEDVLDKSITQFMGPNISKEVNLVIEKALSGQSVTNFELPFISKGGTLVILLISISPRMDVNQNIYGAICVGQDITELFHYRQGLEKMVKERTQDLNEALLKEKELVDLKSKFISIASHEFRTPLSIISLASGVLKKHKDKMSTSEYEAKLDMIEKQVNHMTYLLNDILVIGKGEAGKIGTNYAPVQIEEFFTQTAREVEQSHRTHKIKIRISATIKEFYSDEKLLRNILINLLTNAIKFSNYIKDIYLTVSTNHDQIRIEVEDKGIGISEEDLKNIYNAFQRGGNVGAIQGTGLGLSIVKKAVELLKGEISVTSRLGKGTTFSVTIPNEKNSTG